MKKTILTLATLLVAALGYAQTPATPTAAPTGEQSEWLPSFGGLEVDAPLDIKFVRVPDTQAPRIIYDTKGSYTTRFKAEVKDKVLRISERADARRTDRTTVEVQYNDLRSVKIQKASATFEGQLTAPMLDLTVGGGAKVVAKVDVKDLWMDVSGKSDVNLTGAVRYLTLQISSGKLDARQMETLSAQVNASGSSSALLWVTERLEASTSTGGVVTYKGTPTLLRTSSKFMGGEILRIE